jgi:hypothetical protein
MRHTSLRAWRCIVLASALLVAAMPGPAPAAQIAQAASAFQTCLDGQFDRWVKARVNLVLNEDPSAGDVDDASVAKWTVEAATACRAKAGGSDAKVEERFAKRMGQWREHIYNGVQRMRELVRPD